MKKLLLLALLIVGCDNSIDSVDEIKDVAWVLIDKQILSDHGHINPERNILHYYTEGYEPVIFDSTSSNCGQAVIELPDFSGIVGGCYLLASGDTLANQMILLTNGDTLSYWAYSPVKDVRSITHVIEPNIYEIFESNVTIPISIYILPEEYDVFKYGYK